jgi:hypothetical protein
MLISLALSTATALHKDTRKKAEPRLAARKKAGEFTRISRKAFIALDKGAQLRYLKQFPQSSHRFLLNGADTAQPDAPIKEVGVVRNPGKNKSVTPPVKEKPKKPAKHFVKPISREDFDALTPDRQARYKEEHTKFSRKHFTEKKRNITQKPDTGVTEHPDPNATSDDKKQRVALEEQALNQSRIELKQDLKHDITPTSVRAASKVTQQDLQNGAAGLAQNKTDNVRRIMDDLDERTSFTPITTDDLDKIQSNSAKILKDTESHFTDDEKKAVKELTKKAKLGLNRFTQEEVALLEKIKKNKEDPPEPLLDQDGEELPEVQPTPQSRRARRRSLREYNDETPPSDPRNPSRRRRTRRSQNDPAPQDTPDDAAGGVDDFTNDADDSTPSRRGFIRQSADEVTDWEKSAFWRRDWAAMKKIMAGEQVFPDGRPGRGKGKGRRAGSRPGSFGSSNLMVLGTMVAKYALIGLGIVGLAAGAAPVALHVMMKLKESWGSLDISPDENAPPEERRGGSWGAFGSASKEMTDVESFSMFYDLITDQLLHTSADELHEDVASQFPKFLALSSSVNKVSFRCKPNERALPISAKSYWDIYYGDALAGRMETNSKSASKLWTSVLYENAFSHLHYPHLDHEEAALSGLDSPFVLIDEGDERENDMELHNPTPMPLNDARVWVKRVISEKYGVLS